MTGQTTTVPLTDRFAGLCELVASKLPFGLNRIVPPTFLGFAVINSFTFGVDLVLLTVFHGWWDWPSPVAVSLAYALAFGLAFVLNRAFNFRSHAPVGGQMVKYVIVVVINYLAFILGVGAGLTELGVQYHLARLAAGACEAVYMYAMMRWVVFREPSSGRASR
ncbi:GtrA family protein [Amycolatopsis suaedae]|uniref:GtrA family protein n=1 Tax=Amycolatopsis suaedae TaxID=2510978 RepID=UPI001F1059E6|nr:GtrA family protein [Amycolatopsis suaedae]